MFSKIIKVLQETTDLRNHQRVHNIRKADWNFTGFSDEPGINYQRAKYTDVRNRML